MHVTKNIIWHVTWSHLKHMKHWTPKQYWNSVYWVWSLVRDLLKELFAEALWRNGCLSDHVGHLRSHFPIASPRHLLIALRLFQFCGLNPYTTLGSDCMDWMEALLWQNGNIDTQQQRLEMQCVYMHFKNVYIYIYVLYNIRRSKCTLEFMKERCVASFSSSTIKWVPQQ